MFSPSSRCAVEVEALLERTATPEFPATDTAEYAVADIARPRERPVTVLSFASPVTETAVANCAVAEYADASRLAVADVADPEGRLTLPIFAAALESAVPGAEHCP